MTKKVEMPIWYWFEEGFLVGHVTCVKCLRQWLAACNPKADVTNLECPYCRERNKTTFVELTYHERD